MVFPRELAGALRGRGSLAAIQEWFSTGTRDPDETNEKGGTLLTCAARGGSIEAMLILLAHGASVHASDSYSDTPLHVTAYSGHLAAAIVLLDHGAQVDARDDDGFTPLMQAAVIGYCDLIRLLLHHGADINAHEGPGDNAEAIARRWKEAEAADLLGDVRRAGGWRPYARYPRFRVLMLRILAEQDRAETQDPLLRRLFPTGPPITDGARLKAALEESDFRDIDAEALAAILVAKGLLKELKRPREAYRAQKGGRLPRGIFVHIIGYWRSSRDYLGPAPDGA